MRFLLLFLSLFNIILARQTIYIFPPGGYGVDAHGVEKLFDLRDMRLNEDNRSMPFVKLREGLNSLGYDCKIANGHLRDCAGIIVCALPDAKTLERIAAKYKSKSVQLIFEPPILIPQYYNPQLQNHFAKIFIMLDQFVNDRSYVKFFYPQVNLVMTNKKIPFAQKKLCTLITKNNPLVHHYAELYSKRRGIIQFFEKNAPQDFDFYGHGWNAQQHPCYKGDLVFQGDIPSKVKTLPHYKFSICFENSRFDGYITEKIFDSMIAGCVPVYWGAPNVTQFIPENCFINRDKFQSNQELYQFLINMSESEHAAYIEAIKEFLESPQAGFFSQEYFIHTMISFFIPHYDMTKVFTPDQLDKLLRTLAL